VRDVCLDACHFLLCASITHLCPYSGLSIFQANGETYGLIRNASGAERGVRLRGIDIDENSQGIFEGFFHEDEIYKRTHCPFTRCAPLQLDRYDVSLVSPFRETSFKWDMKDDIRANLNAVITQTFLILLLDDWVFWQHTVTKPHAQLMEQSPLEGPFIPIKHLLGNTLERLPQQS